MENIKDNKQLNILNILIKGFSLGMVLQLAVGPVCLYVFKNSIEKGFLYAELMVIGVFIIDAFYIFWAIFGISSFLKYKKTKLIVKIIGFIILLFFGINIILSEVAKVNLIPSFSFVNNIYIKNPFITGLIITLANPLTIIFWIGIFSSKIVESNYTRREIVIYGSGAVLSTLFFLSVIAVIGIIIKAFLPAIIITILNILIGLLIIFFAFRLLLKKDKD